MKKSDITTLVQFNFWANERLLAACGKLSPEQFTRPVSPDPGWGDLREVLAHILDVEFGWRAVMQKEDAETILEGSYFEDVAALKGRWEEEKAAWLNFAGELNNTDLEKPYTDGSEQKTWQTIMHVITHGIQHRSEAALILTGYGHSPGELDFGIFLRDHPDKFDGEGN